jgi:hypothetical protein
MSIKSIRKTKHIPMLAKTIAANIPNPTSYTLAPKK